MAKQAVKISSNELFNRQVNYTIIKSFWRYTHKDNIQELYDRLNVTRNYFSRIVTANTYNIPDLERKWQSKTDKGVGLYVLGLPKRYMLGQEMIEVEGITVSDWQNYFTNKYGKSTSYTVSEKRRKFHNKLNKAFAKLQIEGVRIASSQPIHLLHYYMVNDRPNTTDNRKDWEIKELRRLLGLVKASHWKECEDRLLKVSIGELERQLNMAKLIYGYREIE